jgi:alkylated DNA repair protein (DNA oxidative demethylase)
MEHDGFQFFPEAIDVEGQKRLVADVTAAVVAAPFYRPKTPGGKAMSVMQTNLGAAGWVSDERGYRYQPRHPATDEPWPAMPQNLLALWARFADPTRPPDCCLVNLYRGEARMGLHQDADEADRTAPVLSISLGDPAVFRLGGVQRRDPTRSFRLSSGDVCVLAGASRSAFHGIDRILAGGSSLVPGGGRLNLTLRRALS